MNGWWRKSPDNAIDWVKLIPTIESYFPSTRVEGLTMSNLFECIRIYNLAHTSEKSVDGMAPDDFFEKVMAGELSPDDITEQPKSERKLTDFEKKLEEARIRSMGFLK